MLDMTGWEPLIEQVRLRYGVNLEATNTGGSCYRFEGRLEDGSWIIALPDNDFVGTYEGDVAWQEIIDSIKNNGIIEGEDYDWLVFQSPNCIEPDCVASHTYAHPCCQQVEQPVTFGVLLTGSKPHQLPDSIALGLQAITRKIPVDY